MTTVTHANVSSDSDSTARQSPRRRRTNDHRRVSTICHLHQLRLIDREVRRPLATAEPPRLEVTVAASDATVETAASDATLETADAKSLPVVSSPTDHQPLSPRGDAPSYISRPGMDAAVLAPVPSSTAAEDLTVGG